MTNSRKIALFSRDDRTFKLFRGSWIKAIIESRIPFSVVNRGFGFLKAWIALINFNREYKNVRIIFGTSEICLYSAFSSKDDIWVFTGIGRLLQYQGKVQKLVTLFLKCAYRQQKIVALNPQDVVYLESIFPTKVILINGEGFAFNITSPIKKNKTTALVIAYVGRLLKSKGVDRLIEAFIRLPQLNCELRLIGDFDFSNSDAISTEWLAEMQSVSNNKISCYGFVYNVRDLLKEVDIYVSLSDREGLPFAALEAIEAGCIIVLSPVPGHLSFADFKGIIFDGSKDLHMILEDLLTHPDKYYHFDASYRLKICNTRFGIESIVADIKSKIL
jgi:glycosyltransferase involved in cell wall biosynthesis